MSSYSFTLCLYILSNTTNIKEIHNSFFLFFIYHSLINKFLMALIPIRALLLMVLKNYIFIFSTRHQLQNWDSNQNLGLYSYSNNVTFSIFLISYVKLVIGAMPCNTDRLQSMDKSDQRLGVLSGPI